MSDECSCSMCGETDVWGVVGAVSLMCQNFKVCYCCYLYLGRDDELYGRQVKVVE